MVNLTAQLLSGAVGGNVAGKLTGNEGIRTPMRRIEEILRDLSESRGEHVLSFDGPNPDMEAFLAKTFTGAASPADRRREGP